jgi:hypothetical protein
MADERSKTNAAPKKCPHFVLFSCGRLITNDSGLINLHNLQENLFTLNLYQQFLVKKKKPEHMTLPNMKNNPTRLGKYKF